MCSTLDIYILSVIVRPKGPMSMAIFVSVGSVVMLVVIYHHQADNRHFNQSSIPC